MLPYYLALNRGVYFKENEVFTPSYSSVKEIICERISWKSVVDKPTTVTDSILAALKANNPTITLHFSASPTSKWRHEFFF